MTTETLEVAQRQARASTDPRGEPGQLVGGEVVRLADHAVVARLAAAARALDKAGHDLVAAGDRAAAVRAFVQAGDAMVTAGDREAMLDAYRKAFGIAEKLVADDPGNAAWQRYLSGSTSRIGNVLVDAGDRKAARVAYGKSLAISEKLAAANPGNAAWCGTQPDKIEGEGGRHGGLRHRHLEG